MTLHWPEDATHCACGDTFNEGDLDGALRHARAYIPAWKHIRFKPQGEDTGVSVTATPGHAFRYVRHPFVPGYWVVVCRCGWEAPHCPFDRIEHWARGHIQTFIVNRIGGYQ